MSEDPGLHLTKALHQGAVFEANKNKAKLQHVDRNITTVYSNMLQMQNCSIETDSATIINVYVQPLRSIYNSGGTQPEIPES